MYSNIINTHLLPSHLKMKLYRTLLEGFSCAVNSYLKPTNKSRALQKSQSQTSHIYHDERYKTFDLY